MKARVILETPFRAKNDEELMRNINFARRCMKDSLNRDEAPLVFHMLYPMIMGGPLDDSIPEERKRGFAAARNWYDVAEKVVVYNDLGISPGMEIGIEEATDRGITVVFRTLKESPHKPQEELPKLPFSDEEA